MGSGWLGEWGGWVVWVVLRLVGKVRLSSVSRCRVAMLWWCVGERVVGDGVCDRGWV